MNNSDMHVMLDLETFGISNEPVILAIGAVKFCKAGIIDEFYTTVDPYSCEEVGLKIDVSTVMWWMKQSDDARKAICVKTEASAITFALAKFCAWYGCEELPVWGNGVKADNIWIESAFKATNLKMPWSYRADRCYRTIRAMFPDIRVPDVGTSHHALDDATYQAKTLIAIWNHMEGKYNV